MRIMEQFFFDSDTQSMNKSIDFDENLRALKII